MRRVHRKSLATEGGEFEGGCGSTAFTPVDLQVLGSTFEVKKHSKWIRNSVGVFVFRECVLWSFWGVSGVLGELFGLHRHERIAYSLFSRKALKV